jgi:transcriptional regulator EpsA
MNGAYSNDETKTDAMTRQNRAEDAPFAPSTQELERMLFAIESSLQVNRRFQFFLWAQGVLQAFLPHQTLICATGNLEAQAFKLDSFASDVVNQASDPESEAALHALLQAGVAAWADGGYVPLTIDAQSADSNSVHGALNEAILELGLGNVLMHGSREFATQCSFFVFGRMPIKPGRRSVNLLESLLPILHFALYRYRQNEAAQSNTGPVVAILSDREIEIVQSVCVGKTNSEIGVDLSISPLTVKNHMQRILRKLNVNNRAQAVARCIALGLFENRKVG